MPEANFSLIENENQTQMLAIEQIEHEQQNVVDHLRRIKFDIAGDNPDLVKHFESIQEQAQGVVQLLEELKKNEMHGESRNSISPGA